LDSKKSPVELFTQWYSELKLFSGSFPAKGAIAGALVVLDRLKESYNLDINFHTTDGGAQIKGVSGEAVKRILIEFGETRPFLSEGGRTNRGLLGNIQEMLKVLDEAKLEVLSKEKRNNILTSLQQFLVDKVCEFHNQQRLKIVYNPQKSTRQLIHELLAVARENVKEGPVAQYLVGAKLTLRFPDLNIRNESYSTADVQLGRHGDFEVGDTAFHVTVAPMAPLYQKCKVNIDEGFRAFILVPDDKLGDARYWAEQNVPGGKIAVESIESFVSQNIEELSLFSNGIIKDGFKRLLETYNERVNQVDIDKSKLIEIPRNLMSDGEDNK
jgi:hypothetical protein